MDKSITDHHIFCKYIVGIFFKYSKIQYAAVTQNINTILYDCTLSDLQINIVNYLHECELQ